MTQQQIEFAAKDIVFHFNKKHLEDQTIPMWVLKAHGETFYVNHVDCEMPWSTKETPDNSHTKGSLKMKACHVIIDENNNATLKKLTLLNKARLKHSKPFSTRVMSPWDGEFHNALKNKEYEHSRIKFIRGACSSPYIVCDISKRDATFALLKYTGLRILNPNEHYYQAYDDKGTTITADYSDEDTPYEYS